MSSFVPDKFIKNGNSDKICMFSLVESINDKQINLNPDYQRDECWDDEAKTLLIQSLMGGIPVPQILVSEDTKTGVWTVIDGKQRLSTFRDFMADKVKIYNRGEPENSYVYSELDKKHKKQFNNINIDYWKGHNLSDEQQRDIFERINHGEILTIGEKIKGRKSDIISKILHTKKQITSYLNNLGNSEKRDSYMEYVTALLALYKNHNKYITKGKQCLEYIDKIISKDNNIQFDDFEKKIVSCLKKLTDIHNDICSYAKTRKYKSAKYKKMRWTDTLVYLKMLLDSFDDTKETEKIIEVIQKYIIHSKSYCIFINQTDNEEYPEPVEYSEYKSLFDTRSNTNVPNFFEKRIESIHNLYKYTQRKHTQEEREKIYSRCGTAGESICKLCNIHSIYPTNFQAAHIISKRNGGCPGILNAIPTCQSCNNSMGIKDLDLYCLEKCIKIDIIKYKIK